jgi:hypothetical protein
LWTSILIGGLATVCVGKSAAHGDDLVQDYVSARAGIAGEPPYQDAAELRERFGFPPAGQPVSRNPHPPVSILLVAGVAWLPFPTALLVYQVVQVLALGVTWKGACRMFARGGWGAATLGGALGLWAPVWQGLDWGQPIGIVAATSLLLWQLARANPRPGFSGAALGFACSLRPFNAIVVATAVRWPVRRLLFEALAAIAVVAVLFAIVRLSPLKWLRAGEMVGETFADQCGSIPGLLGLMGLLGMACYAIAFAGVATARWRGVEIDTCFAAALVFGMLAYPLAWFHYDVALIPVLVWVVARAHARQRSTALFAVAIYLALRAVPNIVGHQVLQQWLQVAGRSALAAAVLMTARQVRANTDGPAKA